MKYSFKYMFATLCAFLCVTGCDDKLEVFETNGSAVAPVAFDISKVEVESLPGAIQLTWPATEEGFAYMKVRYNDPLQKKEICRLLSNNATGLLKIHVHALVIMYFRSKLLMLHMREEV